MVELVRDRRRGDIAFNGEVERTTDWREDERAGTPRLDTSGGDGGGGNRSHGGMDGGEESYCALEVL